MFYTILGWIIGVFDCLSFILLCFLPLLTKRKDETFRMRIFSLFTALLNALFVGHALGVFK